MSKARFTIAADPTGAQTTFWSATNFKSAAESYQEAQDLLAAKDGGLVSIYFDSEYIESTIIEGTQK